jgi:hypothetical protein
MKPHRQSIISPKRLEYLGAHDDAGQTPRAGNTHWFRDETGQRYVAKCGDGSFPYAAVNELVAAALARAMGVATPEFFLRDFEGTTFFFSQELPYPKAKAFGRRHLSCDVFRAEFSRVLVFDVWVMNRDRHASNYLIRVEGDDHHVVAFDHDRTLFDDGPIRRLEQRVMQEPQYLLCRPLEQLLRAGTLTLPMSQVEGSIAVARGVPGPVIASAVRGLPDALLEPAGKEALERVLLDRQRALPSLLSRVVEHAPVRSAFIRAEGTP